ncbi:hypothetical protein D3C73_989650 [compost metagenome]
MLGQCFTLGFQAQVSDGGWQVQILIQRPVQFGPFDGAQVHQRVVVLVDQGLLHGLAKMPVILAQVLIGDDTECRVDHVFFGGDGAQVVADPAPGHHAAFELVAQGLEFRMMEERHHALRVVRPRGIKNFFHLAPVRRTHCGAPGPGLVEPHDQLMIDLGDLDCCLHDAIPVRRVPARGYAKRM